MVNIAEQRIVAKPKPRTQADIVFCVDATKSMAPCIEGVKAGLKQFAEGLQSAATVDFRLCLIAYRDLHDPSCNVKWDEFDFTSDIKEFESSLSTIKAECGQRNRGAESTLDAIYRAIHSEWREHRTHRTIVVLTDDDTHPTLHSSTFSGFESRPHVRRVIQDFNEMTEDRSSVILFMVAPEYPLYLEIEKGVTQAKRDCIWRKVPTNDERYYGLNNIKWSALLNMLGKTISSSSINCEYSDKDKK
jgi:von Willebrand factor type A domain